MKINIGTTKGCIVGFEIKKRWVDITTKDLFEIVNRERPGARIVGWAPTHKAVRTKIQRGLL